MSWGYNDNMLFSGYITINGNKVISTTSSSSKGFNMAELNMSSCSASNLKNFNTGDDQSDSDAMATYINGLPSNTVLIGVTADEASKSLTQNVKSALLAIGVNVSALTFRGKVAFAALIGQPSKSVSQVAPPGVYNLKINVNVNGSGE